MWFRLDTDVHEEALTKFPQKFYSQQCYTNIKQSRMERMKEKKHLGDFLNFNFQFKEASLFYKARLGS